MAEGQRFALDIEKNNAGFQYLEWLREALASGKSLGGVIRDVARLGWGPGRLQPSEYFMYRLYDDARIPMEAKRTFIGADRLAKVRYALNMPWPRIASDKPTLTALLRGYELPIPDTQALRHGERAFPGAMSLRSKSDVERFLRDDAIYPIFTKPADRVSSLGVANIERYDRASDCLITNNGQQVDLAEFAEQVEQFADDGYLFQTRLEPHPEVANVVGDQLSTVRMFVLEDDDGPTLLRASWKIPSGVSVADNFWRSGNMLGGIDVETGEVLRVLRHTATSVETVDEHPRTGASFEGLKFPHWDDMRRLVMQAAAAVPSCHFQGWDVALTDDGPVLVELEGDGGDPIMEQLCFDTGLLQGRYLAFAERALRARKDREKQAKARLWGRVRNNISQLSMNQPKADIGMAPHSETEETQEEDEKVAATSA